MTEMNQTMRSITGTEEDQAKPFTVDLRQHSWEGGISDHVIEGRYLLQTTGARYVGKKSGVGVNIRFTFSVVGPPGCSEVGKTLISYHPIEPGDPGNPEVQKKNAFIQNAVASMLDFADKYRRDVIDNLTPSSLTNTTLAAWVTERKLPATGDYPERIVGEIKSYLPKEKYEKAPGPTTGRAKESSEIPVNVAPKSGLPVTGPAPQGRVGGDNGSPITADPRDILGGSW